MATNGTPVLRSDALNDVVATLPMNPAAMVAGFVGIFM
jgi:hypothetical protein